MSLPLGEIAIPYFPKTNQASYLAAGFAVEDSGTKPRVALKLSLKGHLGHNCGNIFSMCRNRQRESSQALVNRVAPNYTEILRAPVRDDVIRKVHREFPVIRDGEVRARP